MLLSRNQILHIFLQYDYGMEIGKHTVQVLLYEASRHVNYHRAAPGGWTKQAPLSRWSDLMIFFLSLFLSLCESLSLSLSCAGRVHCSNGGIKCCDKKIRNLFYCKC